MNRIKSFSMFESAGAEVPGLVTAHEFAQDIGLGSEECDKVADWWSRNRPGIKIHYFRFKLGVMGGLVAPDAVAINQAGPRDPLFKLYLLLHESFHAVQHARGPEFHDGYFGSVVAGDEHGFVEAYKSAEREANDHAIEGMRELGFGDFVRDESRVRGNEHAARAVMPMMHRDIQRTGAKDMFELIKSQLI
jgi:hypothetical protein